MGVYIKQAQAKLIFGCLLILFMVWLASPIYASPIALTTIGSNYTEEFNYPEMAMTGSTGTALPDGWAMNQSSYYVGTGSLTTGGMRDYGPLNQEDRALGSLSNGITPLLFGAQFQNTSGYAIDSLDIQYIGEQWRQGANTSLDYLYFEYSLDATSLTTGNWTGVSALNFQSPHTGTTGTALNGNLSANRVIIQFEIPDLYIVDDAVFWIRFRDVDIAGWDHGLAVDDFNITPLSTSIPLPASALLLGSGLLGLAGLRKRIRFN